MPDIFPAELISEVVSYLDPANIEDLHALMACNLVSLTFSAASRAVLFHTICISPHLTVHGFYERTSAPHYDAIVGLISVLSQSPHLPELVRVIYLDDLERDVRLANIQLETNNPLLKSFWNVRSLYIFGRASLPAYNYLSQNLGDFPNLCTLAVSSRYLDMRSASYPRYSWQIHVPDEAHKSAGKPDVPLHGTENWCLTRNLGADGVPGNWTLSAVKVYRLLVNNFSTGCPKVLWSIPHLTMPITLLCTSFTA
jgi:hypothetical protein